MGDESYFAANADLQEERARLAILEAEFDPASIRYLKGVGVAGGWRCLELGAGGGSVTRWLADRVGAGGQVVATDIDPRFLTDLDLLNVEVRRHDITADELATDHFDIVHCRFLLMHMKDPGAVFSRMVAALRPGGWVVAEEPDLRVVEATDDSHPLAERFTSSYRRGMEFLTQAKIYNAWMGRDLPALFETAGLEQLGNEGITNVVHGGDPLSLMWIQTWDRLREHLDGVLSDADLDGLRMAYEDPSFTYRSHVSQAVWGQRPG